MWLNQARVDLFNASEQIGRYTSQTLAVVYLHKVFELQSRCLAKGQMSSSSHSVCFVFETERKLFLLHYNDRCHMLSFQSDGREWKLNWTVMALRFLCFVWKWRSCAEPDAGLCWLKPHLIDLVMSGPKNRFKSCKSCRIQRKEHFTVP